MLPGRGSLRVVGVAVAEGHMALICVAGIVAVGGTSLKLHTPRLCVLVALCCSAVGLIPSRVVPCVHSVAMVGGRACHAITMASGPHGPVGEHRLQSKCTGGRGCHSPQADGRWPTSGGGARPRPRHSSTACKLLQLLVLFVGHNAVVLNVSGGAGTSSTGDGSVRGREW